MLIDRKLIQLARTALRPFILTLLSGAALSGMIILQAGTLSRILSLAFIEKRRLFELRGMLAFLFGVIIIRSLLVWGNIVFASHFARDVKIKLRENLFMHLFNGGITWRRQVEPGELSSIFLQGVDALEAYFSQYLPQVIFAGITPVLILLVVFPLDALSALIFCITAPLIPVLMILIGSTSEAATKRQWLGLSRMSAYFLDSIQGLETLKIFDRDRNRVARVAEISDQYREKTMAVLRITFLSALVLEFISTISTAVIAVQIGLRLLLGLSLIHI